MNKLKAIQPFDAILRQINNGRLVDDITDEMTEVLEAVKLTGKAGKISITLSFHPGGPANNQMEIKPSIKGTKPELARPISIFFVNDNYGLQRDDPTQRPLPGIKPVEEIPQQPGVKANDR